MWSRMFGRGVNRMIGKLYETLGPNGQLSGTLVEKWRGWRSVGSGRLGQSSRNFQSQNSVSSLGETDLLMPGNATQA